MGTPVELRMQSLAHLRTFGYPEPPAHFPLLDDDLRLRATDDIVTRVGALSAVVSVAFGGARSVAWSWLRTEGLTAALSSKERVFLDAGDGHDPDEFQVPESLYTLAWSVGLLEGADDFGSFVPDSLIHVVPHPPPNPESVSTVRSRVALLDDDRIAAALDLAYCLHWGVVESGLRGDALPEVPDPRVIVERRHALEWLVADEPWDDVEMST